jgi:membrane dipeptidase
LEFLKVLNFDPNQKHFSMKIFHLFVPLVLCLSFSCQQSKIAQPKTDEELRVYANDLAQRFILVDTHVDLPYRLKGRGWTINEDIIGSDTAKAVGDTDFRRAKQGGLDAPFMSIYIPAKYQQKNKKGEMIGGGKDLADSLINSMIAITETFPDHFAKANSPEEIEANFKAGKISLPLGMENGAPIGTDISNVKYFFDRGIRYITLTHSKANQICDSSYDTARIWNGLSPFGEQVVREMNRVGIMVDVSHVDDSTFYDVMKIVSVPVIASHSSCRKFTPGFERNMSDDMIKALAKNGGVIQINFGASFLDSTVRANKAIVDSLGKVLKAKNLISRDEGAAAIIEQFGRHKDFYSDVERVADHIDHVKALVGIDHVGIGSDFDGVGDSLPEGLKDVSMYPNLIFVLLKRGYTDEEIQKVCSGNLFRVWKKVIDRSENL